MHDVVPAPDGGPVSANSEAATDAPSRASESIGLAEVSSRLAELEATCAAVRGLVESAVGADRSKDEAFQRLYADLEHFKGTALLREVRPLLLDLVLILDRIETNRDSLPVEGRGFVDSIHAELLEALARRGVEPVPAGDGGFDRSIQRAVAVEPTSDPAANNQVARVVRRGYTAEGQNLRPEEVVVWRHNAEEQS